MPPHTMPSFCATGGDPVAGIGARQKFDAQHAAICAHVDARFKSAAGAAADARAKTAAAGLARQLHYSTVPSGRGGERAYAAATRALAEQSEVARRATLSAENDYSLAGAVYQYFTLYMAQYRRFVDTARAAAVFAAETADVYRVSRCGGCGEYAHVARGHLHVCCGATSTLGEVSIADASFASAATVTCFPTNASDAPSTCTFAEDVARLPIVPKICASYRDCGATWYFEAVRMPSWVQELYATIAARLELSRPGAADTSLHDAVRRLDIREALSLINAGVDVNCTDLALRTPLHIAARPPDAEMTMHLLLAGADAYAADRLGRRPIHIAAACGWSRRSAPAPAGAPARRFRACGTTKRARPCTARRCITTLMLCGLSTTRARLWTL